MGARVIKHVKYVTTKQRMKLNLICIIDESILFNCNTRNLFNRLNIDFNTRSILRLRLLAAFSGQNIGLSYDDFEQTRFVNGHLNTQICK